MLIFRSLKILIIVALTVFLFLGEITSTFSFKRNDSRDIPAYLNNSFVRNLRNSYSNGSYALAIDSIFNDFIAKNHIRGASIAVTKKGKLVYAHGLGYSNVSDSLSTEPWNLFRIASVSKLITASAVMKLLENGRLRLDDKVFGPSGWLNDSLFSSYRDKRVEDITIYHLLTHTSGWNHKSFDPVFAPLVIKDKYHLKKAAGIDDIIRYTLDRKLDHKPGSAYSYSNTGYCMLGKIIEKASGMKYEDYVQFALLHPLGIFDMHIGKSFPEEMPDEEVMYYINGKDDLYPAFDGSGSRVPLQYGGNNIELIGPAGGWIASAPELIKLIAALDGFDGYPDILSLSSVGIMTRNGKKINQMLGWRGTDGKGTWWRTGTLAGTSAFVMRLNNETNWVILLNTSSSKKTRIHNELYRTIFKCMNTVKDWPSLDLFSI